MHFRMWFDHHGQACAFRRLICLCNTTAVISNRTWVIDGTMLFSVFIWMCIAGVQGNKTTLCVLKGSSVNLTCPDENPASGVNWYIINKHESQYTLTQLPADENYGHITTEGSNATLTITDVRESNENVYCCGETNQGPEHCWNRRTTLQVADLQVKVIPETGERKANLMCKTSCSLNEFPGAFVWYQNRKFVYEDWSPWYQDLVGGTRAVKYSCAVKGYEDHRAPEVSVDSITQGCFVVTYAKGKMCSVQEKTGAKPCSITYPRSLHVQVNPEKDFLGLTCNTSCPAADQHTAFKWYCNGNLFDSCENQNLAVIGLSAHFSCALKHNEDLRADEMCNSTACRYVNYNKRRVCGLEGSSVDISGTSSQQKYLYHYNKWYKIKRNAGEEDDAVDPLKEPRHTQSQITENQHILRIDDLRKNDSGEYLFGPQPCKKCKQSDVPGVMLTVSGLKVTVMPSAEVTEGQRVTLTCTTSCPLTDGTTYTWYFNDQRLNLPKNQNKKHLLLNPVGVQHAGNYSCAVTSPKNISSSSKALTVKEREKIVAIMNYIKLVVLSLISPVGLKLCMTMRRKTVTVAAEKTEKDQPQQADLLYEKILLKSPAAEGGQEQQQ